ncbi:metallophosphoesterase family protein [Neobacillus sp. DY30]|uniref:metallophosphoesterase family protein n=1 Tax=Neobacillus sp. DY30 TaxID=3047871 RepID=UPI0024C05EFE|nr:metallophosphoesterase family protein [Neobacillus sp. DY30]WHY03082.1 metallophosphoesterase family protein [Neobacillus sp. DY30]
MTRFAILTDVHGNAPALKAVLKEIDERRDVDHIYCLGDMLGIGPDSNEVLEMLFSRSDVSMITGNHDEAILALAKGEEYPRSHIHVKEHHQWIVDRLDPSFIPKLEQLPRLQNVTIDGYSILFIHYQIENSKLNEHISRDHFSSIVEPSTENMETLFFDKKADLICFGHHHPLHYFAGKHTVYLNPGSLGCNHKPLAPYAIFTVINNVVDVSLKEVAYDNTAFLKSYDTLQVPEREFILKVFHGNQL